MRKHREPKLAAPLKGLIMYFFDKYQDYINHMAELTAAPRPTVSQNAFLVNATLHEHEDKIVEELAMGKTELIQKIIKHFDDEELFRTLLAVKKEIKEREDESI